MPFGPAVRSITQPGGNFLAIFVMKGGLFIFLITLFACLMKKGKKEKIFLFLLTIFYVLHSETGFVSGGEGFLIIFSFFERITRIFHPIFWRI